MRLFAKYLGVVCVLSEKMSNFVPRTIEIHYGQRHQSHQSRACREGRCCETIECLVEGNQRTNKWLAEQLGCAPTTVSKWCTNACQPPMETYIKIASVLDVEINELLNKKFVSTLAKEANE